MGVICLSKAAILVTVGLSDDGGQIAEQGVEVVDGRALGWWS